MPSNVATLRRTRNAKFKFVLEERRAEGLTSRLAFAMAIVALTIAAAFTIFDLALRTADQVFIDEALLNPPEQADVAFGQHELSFPGAWLTSPIALQDEMATKVSIQIPYDKMLALLGTNSRLQTSEGTVPHMVVIRLQVPSQTLPQVDLLNDIYIPKSAPMVATSASGLAMRKFLANTGYDGEILYTGEENGETFTVRCLPGASAEAGLPIRRPCMRTVSISSDMEAVIQFEPAILEDWRKLDSLVTALVRSITVR